MAHPSPFGPNLAEARRLLAKHGWADHDGDGTLDRDGVPLTLTILPTATSAVRQELAQQVQEQLRQVGIRVELERVEFSLYNERRTSGRFDLDFASTSQDPSPTGLSQGWSCAGGTNVAKYCDPVVDSLMDAAARPPRHSAEAWQAVLRADRGGRSGRVHVRADLLCRGRPAVRQRAHPARSRSGSRSASGR